VLRRLYVDEEQSYADIARRYDVTKTSVKRWLRAAGISARDRGLATSLATKGKPKSEEHRAKLAQNAAIARSRITDESRAKQSASMRGKTPYNKGIPWTPEQRVLLEAARADPEYRERMRQRHTGANNAAWKGGVKPELDRRLDRAEWRRLRRQVYERDGWMCCDCGCKCLSVKDAKAHPKRRIQCHHVVGRRDGGSDELSNLVTLCVSCHHRRERRKADALLLSERE
jgi:5-methylcytosine-specific restriction endonuclease McrA/transposase-like protein